MLGGCAPWRVRLATPSSIARERSTAPWARFEACCRPGRGVEGSALLVETETNPACPLAPADRLGLRTRDRPEHAGTGRAGRRANDLRGQFRRGRRGQDPDRTGFGANADR